VQGALRLRLPGLPGLLGCWALLVCACKRLSWLLCGQVQGGLWLAGWLAGWLVRLWVHLLGGGSWGAACPLYVVHVGMTAAGHRRQALP
jgi:hypothetical protein